MGVVVRRYIYRFPHNITYPNTNSISSFFGAVCQFLFSFLKCIFVLVYVSFVQYSKRCSKNIRDHSKIEITWTL